VIQAIRAKPLDKLGFTRKLRVNPFQLSTPMKTTLLIPTLLAVLPVLASQASAQQNVTPDAFSTPPGAPAAPAFLAPPVSKSGMNLTASGNVVIIESQSYNTGHNMDDQWLTVASGMGFTATINPQSTLDSTAFFGTTDILVISSGVISLSSAALTNITDFVSGGGQVYLQGEYLPTYNTNILFGSLVNSLGGSFSLGSTWSGDLIPMAVSGVLSTTPNTVGSIGYHWYGADGIAGALVTPFMHYGGSDFGWMFEAPSGGKVVHNTDQDWIRVATSQALQQNFLAYLSTPGGPSYTITGLVGGGTATLTVTNATAGGGVLIGYSLTGAGPTNTPFGPVDLSAPITQLPTLTADGAGVATMSTGVPARASGFTVYSQAADLSSGLLTNSLAEVVL
jgi:hypothetical protein